MKRFAKKIVIIFIFIIFAIVTFNIWMPLPGRFLLVKDNIQKADCIVLLAGDTFFRFRKAVELYDNGSAKRIVHSVIPERDKPPREYYNFDRRLKGLKDMSEKELALRALKYFGKTSEDVYFTETGVTSTFDEAVASKKYMLTHGLKSMILVTSTYHMRRALMIFMMVFRGTGIKIYNATAVNTLFDPGHWWRSEKDFKAVTGEYLSICFNVFHHFILGKGMTASDSFQW